MAFMDLDRRRQSPSVFAILGTIRTLIDVSRTRRALRTLEAHRLDDIGVSRAEAMAEAQKISWNVPESWKS